MDFALILPQEAQSWFSESLLRRLKRYVWNALCGIVRGDSKFTNMTGRGLKCQKCANLPWSPMVT